MQIILVHSKKKVQALYFNALLYITAIVNFSFIIYTIILKEIPQKYIFS